MVAKSQQVIIIAAGVVGQVLFLALVTASSVSVSEGTNDAIDNLLGDFNFPLTMLFLGSVNGKGYFAEVNQTMNRTAAATYCSASRLELASIETQAEADFLNKRIPELGISTWWYWTSAKESRTDSMFVWNGSGAQLNSSFVSRNEMISGEYYCVALDAFSTGSIFRIRTCATGYLPLCQAQLA